MLLVYMGLASPGFGSEVLFHPGKCLGRTCVSLWAIVFVFAGKWLLYDAFGLYGTCISWIWLFAVLGKYMGIGAEANGCLGGDLILSFAGPVESTDRTFFSFWRRNRGLLGYSHVRAGKIRCSFSPVKRNGSSTEGEELYGIWPLVDLLAEAEKKGVFLRP